jgi:hypothetical protein
LLEYQLIGLLSKKLINYHLDIILSLQLYAELMINDIIHTILMNLSLSIKLSKLCLSLKNTELRRSNCFKDKMAKAVMGIVTIHYLSRIHIITRKHKAMHYQSVKQRLHRLNLSFFSSYYISHRNRNIIFTI